ncbi:hypothetical protein HG15A2_42520 [Adhaeretor mobilis]|uniref:Uncharacterized protein n=1 Tax=Adhaeretor mobilis TaxID=1930276 RepID=A0A517N196_9BACT|nr:hypothetical protein HG15A2_42520 [Adhaeretor mobilis]
MVNVERHSPGSEKQGDVESNRPQYIALSGGVNDNPRDPRPHFDEPEAEGSCSCCGGNAANGIFSPNDILAPASETSSLSAVTNRLSNIALFGEVSAFFYDAAGEPLHAYGRSGIIMGGVGLTYRPGLRHFHATTVRQHKADSVDLPGVHPNCGPNFSLVSSPRRSSCRDGRRCCQV